MMYVISPTKFVYVGNLV